MTKAQERRLSAIVSFAFKVQETRRKFEDAVDRFNAGTMTEAKMMPLELAYYRQANQLRDKVDTYGELCDVLVDVMTSD